MTNSPPPNVKPARGKAPRILAGGVDSFYVSVQVEWPTDRQFRLLEALKTIAKASNSDQAARLTLGGKTSDWLFAVKPHGKDGYEWLLTGRELSMKIGNWSRPKQRPSVLSKFRAEALWLHGADAMVLRLRDIIESMGGEVASVKPSRVDICVDVLLPASEGYPELNRQFMTRAQDGAVRTQARKLISFVFGKDEMMGRIYDKALEIPRSGKTWMYDIWKIDAVPRGYRAIRVEFQMRREQIKKLGCDSWEQTRERLPQLWRYSTTKWLRLVDNAKLHHTQQSVVPWWDFISNGFPGAQGVEPAVREKSYSAELKRHASLVIGAINSITAILTNGEPIDTECPLDMHSTCHSALDLALKLVRIDDLEFTKRVIAKQPRYNLSNPSFEEGD